MRPSIIAAAAAATFLLTGCETVRSSRSSGELDPADQRYASMVSEVGSLRERLGQVELDLNQVRQDNAQLRADLELARSNRGDAVSQAQLNQAVAQIKADNNEQRREVLGQVNKSVEDLAKRTNQALEQMAKQMNTRAATVRAAPAPTQSLPPDTPGQVYTVQAGDTLSTISRKFGASVADIQRANQLTGSTIKVGQNLFIPEKR